MHPIQRNNRSLLLLVTILSLNTASATSVPVPDPSARFSIAACKNSDRGKLKSPEACVWWYRAPAASDIKFSKLVIFFAGGEQSCAITGAENSLMGYGKLAQSYVNRGYVFVCANLFEKSFSDWSGKLPFYAEGPRVDALVKNITTHPEIARRWNGERLLISGVSHGATAPVIAMKHNRFDKESHWKGTKTTGACFMDGQYDVYFNQLFWLLPENQAACSWIYERNVCERYLNKKECDVQTRNVRVIEADTLVGTDTGVHAAKSSDFEIRHWKLVECGSGLTACGNTRIAASDLFPAAPIRVFCDVLKSGPTEDAKNCVYSSEPTKSHIECGLHGVADLQCMNWFDEIE